MAEVKVVALDFDGVFVWDSDAVFKKQAWLEAFKDYPGYEPYLTEGNQLYGWGKPGGRIEIMRHVFEQLGKPAEEIDSLVDHAAQVFDDYVQAKIKEVGLTLGVKETLEELDRRGIALYLNSGTANAALETSATNLGIMPFLKRALGSTKSKVANLTDIAKWEGVEPHEILVVGDGDSDVKAAREFGAQLVGVANRHNGWTEGEKDFPLIEDLRGVIDYV